MSKKRKVRLELTRRDFLALAGTAVGSAVVAEALTTGPLSPFAGLKQVQTEGGAAAEHASSQYRWGMVINLDTCIGCQYCTRACTAVNDVYTDKTWNIVVRRPDQHRPPSSSSAAPACTARTRPASRSARSRRPGSVRTAWWSWTTTAASAAATARWPAPTTPASSIGRPAATPIRYEPTWGTPEVKRRPRGVVEKCTFCIQRIDAGLAKGLTPGEDREATPACVNICPVNARTFGNLNNPDSKISKVIAGNPTFRLREELGTGPGVYYIPPKEGL